MKYTQWFHCCKTYIFGVQMLMFHHGISLPWSVTCLSHSASTCDIVQSLELSSITCWWNFTHYIISFHHCCWKMKNTSGVFHFSTAVVKWKSITFHNIYVSELDNRQWHPPLFGSAAVSQSSGPAVTLWLIAHTCGSSMQLSSHNFFYGISHVIYVNCHKWC